MAAAGGFGLAGAHQHAREAGIFARQIGIERDGLAHFGDGVFAVAQIRLQHALLEPGAGIVGRNFGGARQRFLAALRLAGGFGGGGQRDQPAQGIRPQP